MTLVNVTKEVSQMTGKFEHASMHAHTIFIDF